MNLNRMITKLQMAILHKGMAISVNRSQFYSLEQKRFIPVISLTTKVAHYDEKKDKWKSIEYEIIRTCSQPEVLECMAEIYEAVDKWQQ